MIEVDLSQIPLGIRVQAEGKGVEAQLLLRDFVEDVAEFAARSFRRKVPIGDTFRTWESVHASEPEKTLYGWTASAGVGPIEKTKPGESPDYPLFVHEGTGLFRKNNPGLIFPQHGNVMVFEGQDGETVFTRYTQGQPAQPYIKEVEDETARYMRLKKRELAALINNLL